MRGKFHYRELLALANDDAGECRVKAPPALEARATLLSRAGYRYNYAFDRTNAERERIIRTKLALAP